MKFLRNSFTTGGGKIHPGGYVRVLAGDSRTPLSIRRKCAEDTGLAIWHPELQRFGKTKDATAHVTSRGHLTIRDARGHFHAYIRTDKAISVRILPGFIARNGYVGATAGEGSSVGQRSFREIVASWESRICTAIDKANSGDQPDFVDNSPFTKVTSEFTKHQRVIIIAPLMTSKDGDGEMVYDLAGNRFDSTTHYPLRYSRWKRDDEAAAYSRDDVYIFAAT